MHELLKPLHDEHTAACVVAERALNRRLQGGCQVPIGAYAVLDGDNIWLRGLVGSPDGQHIIRAELTEHRSKAESMGKRVAELLLAQGAGDILRAVYEAKDE